MSALGDSTAVDLQDRCRKACARLAQQYLERAVRPPEDPELRAWGQYLFSVRREFDPELGAQYGIFGTAAGVEVLATEGAGKFGPVLLRACKVLPAVPAPQAARVVPGPGVAPRTDTTTAGDSGGTTDIHRRFTVKGDLLVTAKLCALLDAAVAVASGVDLRGSLACDPALVAGELLSLRSPEAGWPDHGGPEGEYREPNAHATAIALLSLSRTRSLDDEQMAGTEEAIAWLDGPAAGLQDQAVATLAMAHMAVAALRDRYQDPKAVSAHHSAVLNTCRQGLLDWIRTTRPAEVRRSLEGTEFRLPPSADKEPGRGPDFDFLLYLPHCLVALACVASPELLRNGRARRFALGVAGVVAEEAIAKGYFVAAGRGLVATVEHLWLYRLLRAVGTAPALQPSSPAVAADRIKRLPTKTMLGVFLFVTVVVAGALRTSTDNYLFLGVLAIVSGVAGSLIVRAILGKP